MKQTLLQSYNITGYDTFNCVYFLIEGAINVVVKMTTIKARVRQTKIHSGQSVICLNMSSNMRRAFHKCKCSTPGLDSSTTISQGRLEPAKLKVNPPR